MSQQVIEEIEATIAGLWWISEADSAWSLQVTETLPEILQDQPKLELAPFFANAVQVQSWYGDEETEQAQKYQALVELLKQNCSDLAAYRVGEVEVDIYVVGQLESDWIVLQTQAVET